MQLKFSIITPSYNMLNYLKLCHASVVSQTGVSVEHIVVDGGSTDGTVEWLKYQKGIKWISELDNGMYDALNKGFEMASGNIIGHLNADEQYLPNTLKNIYNYYISNNNTDIIFGDTIIIDKSGNYICSKKSYYANKWFLLSSHLYFLTSTMFFKRKIIDEGNRYNINFKNIGDIEFVVRLFDKKYKFNHIKEYFALFTITGKNLSYDNSAKIEWSTLIKKYKFIQFFKIPLNLVRIIIKILSFGYYDKTPLVYDVFISENEKSTQKVTKTNYKWPSAIGSISE